MYVSVLQLLAELLHTGPYSKFPIKYTFLYSPQHKQGILNSRLIKNPIMPYKKKW